MEIISKENLNRYLSEYDDKLYDLIKQNNSYEELKVESYNKLDDIYQINDKIDNLSVSKIKYFKEYIENYYSHKVNEYHIRIKNRENIIEKVKLLKELKLPEQRSKEWYQLRECILTASSLADAIGKGHFNTREQLLIQKCGGPRGSVPFGIVEWGVMYEPVATEFYESLNDVTVLEFGLVPHPGFKIFGASPDGICDIDSPENYIGRMLEIKCPPKRKFTNEVPEHYWMQMQGQLESCDLEECDFLQVKFIEYSDEIEYQNDIYKENEIIKIGYSSLNLPKGLVIAFVKDNIEGNPIIYYKYSKLYLSYEDILEWSLNVVSDFSKDYDRIVKHWWKIERYECVLVGRDRKWWLDTQPKIIDFWEDVEHHRKIGIQGLLDKKEEKKKKKTNPKTNPKKKIQKKSYDIDKSIVDEINKKYLIDSD